MGHFNLCDTSEESCSVHFAYVDGDEKKYLNLSFNEEQGIEGYNSAEDVASIIDAWDQRMFISTRRQEAKEFKEFVLGKAEQIEIGNKEARKTDLLAKRDRIDKELAKLESDVA